MTLALETIAAPRHARMALVLAALGTVATLLLVPYALQLRPVPASIAPHLPWLIAVQTLQSFALVGLAAWIGLRVGYRYGLDAPLLRRWLGEGAVIVAPNRWLLAASLGAGTAALVLAIAALWPIEPVSAPTTTWWAGLLASTYGASTEEILCRLLLVPLFVWCGARFFGGASMGVYWSAIALAALLFGAGHLPQLAMIAGHLEMSTAFEVVALNALCGIVFGWLFWRHGLEHAMFAHFSADLVLHVAAPLAAAA